MFQGPALSGGGEDKGELSTMILSDSAPLTYDAQGRFMFFQVAAIIATANDC